jgi:drug/metabolite transporter (DMT)-like permease
VSQFWIGNLFLALSMLIGAAGHVLMKHVMNTSAPSTLNLRNLSSFLTGGTAPLFILALLLIATGFIFWLASLSRLDLSYAYPIACASALLVALFGVLFLGEAMTTRSVAAILLIIGGTALLVPTR